jgi:hypothetical protein
MTAESKVLIPDKEIDCIGLFCPMPIVKTRRRSRGCAPGSFWPCCRTIRPPMRTCGAGARAPAMSSKRSPGRAVSSASSSGRPVVTWSAGAPAPDRVYFDYAGFAPVDPRVLAVMRPFLEAGIGNPSAPHRSAPRLANRSRRPGPRSPASWADRGRESSSPRGDGGQQSRHSRRGYAGGSRRPGT